MLPQIPDDATCLYCGYRLRGLPNAACPECGPPFNPADPQTYRIAATSSRFRPTPLKLAVTTLIAYAACLLWMGTLDPGAVKGSVSMTLQPILMAVTTALALFATVWSYRTRQSRAETTIVTVILLAIILTIHLPSYMSWLDEIARLRTYVPQLAPQGHSRRRADQQPARQPDAPVPCT